MKPSGWVILILSLLLAAAIGIISWGVAALQGKDKLIAAAEEKAASAEAHATEQAALITTLEKSKALQAETIKSQAGTIAKNAVTIAALEKAQVEAHNISGAVIAEGADVKDAFEAGAPIVEVAQIPALTTWYGDVRPRFDPLLARLGLLDAEIVRWALLNADLRTENQDLAAANSRLSIANTEDGITIKDLRFENSALLSDLTGVRADLSAASSALKIKDVLIYGEATVILAETGYIVGHLLGWW